jgi:hypothetical protein
VREQAELIGVFGMIVGIVLGRPSGGHHVLSGM